MEAAVLPLGMPPLAAALLSITMSPSAAVATTHQASVLARRAYACTSPSSFFSGNRLALSALSHQTAATACRRMSSLDSAAASSGVSTSAIRRYATSAVRVGEVANEAEMLVLGIETSCDDTGAAVVSGDGRILGEAIASQADLLARWGGVVPKLAQDEHQKFIDKVVADALQNARVQEADLSAVAVTIGPGLSLCLRGANGKELLSSVREVQSRAATAFEMVESSVSKTVGMCTEKVYKAGKLAPFRFLTHWKAIRAVGVRKARTLARTHQLPLVGVHHMEAHALVVRLTEKAVQFPFVVLLVSGGHNLLLLAKNVGDYVQLGTTIDDAIGEAYDKTARLLGLDLKRGGGPALEEIAREGNPKSIPLSVPMRGIKYRDCNFSYAGLKNQVRMAIEARNIEGDRVPLLAASSEDRQVRADIAASFQRVAVQHLEDKCRRAIEWACKLSPSVTTLVVSGGVASNQEVRGKLSALAEDMGLQLFCPPPRLCTDNGVMVAWAGIEHLRLGIFEEPPSVDEPDDVYLDLRPRWQLGEVLSEGSSAARSLKKAGSHPSLTAQFRTILSERR